MPRVIVTRPAEQAAAWVERLGARGIEAVALPLIAIAPAADRAPLAAAWAGLATRRLVVFVSPSAVASFFAARPPGLAWPEGVGAGAPGPGTAEALAAQGIAEAAIVAPDAAAAQFDSEALWALLQPLSWRDAGVLIVRGERGRPWLGERLAAAGARVDELGAYRRVVPALSAPEQARLASALVAPERHLWLFSSSEAIANLERVAGTGRWSASRAIATHARIAERARAAGFGAVVEAKASLDGVMACIQSFGP